LGGLLKIFYIKKIFIVRLFFVLVQ